MAISEVNTKNKKTMHADLKNEISYDQDKLFAAVCYGLFPPIAISLSILMILLKKDQRFIQFHAKQGLIFGVIGLITMLIPFANIFLAYIAFPIIAIIAGVKAYQGEKWNMPVIDDLAHKINYKI